MKTYTVELKRVSYSTLNIDAANEDEAEELAWRAVETNPEYRANGATWELNHIEDEATV